MKIIGNNKKISTVEANDLYHSVEINDIDSSVKHLLVCEENLIPKGVESFENIIKNEFLKNFTLSAEFSSCNWHNIKGELSAFLTEHFKGKEGFVAEIKILAEELLLNAFFNAPIDSDGNKLYVKRKRSENVILKDKNTELSILSYNKSVMVNVTDYFGTLSSTDILSQIISGRNRKVSELSEDRYGAGMGLGLIYKYADILIFYISKGICTDISLIKFRKRVGYKLICTFNA